MWSLSGPGRCLVLLHRVGKSHQTDRCAGASEAALGVVALELARLVVLGALVDVDAAVARHVRVEADVTDAAVRAHRVHAAPVPTRVRHRPTFVDIWKDRGQHPAEFS